MGRDTTEGIRRNDNVSTGSGGVAAVQGCC